MKQVFIALIVIFLAIRITTLFPSIQPLKPQQPREQLLPEFLEPNSFADILSGAKNMYDDECLANAIQAGNRDLKKSISNPVRAGGSHGRRAQVTVYLVCTLQRAGLVPERLCAGNSRSELTRFMRGYFRLLERLKDAPSVPPAFADMQRRVESGSGIISGEEDFSPDTRIISGFKNLIRDGLYPEPDTLADALRPEVPEDIIEELTATAPGEAICNG